MLADAVGELLVRSALGLYEFLVSIASLFLGARVRIGGYGGKSCS